MEKLLLITGFITISGFLSGCHSTQSNEPSALATDAFQKSKCQNCTLEPFYIGGQWIKGRN